MGAGIVVTHGTDALEEVAYFVDEVVGAPMSIVFTGAMRPSWADGYDGLRNLENGLRVAARVPAEYGTLVTMHDEIFEAWSVYKADTGALHAFTARRGAARGCIFGDQIMLPWRPVLRSRFGKIPPTLPQSVPILTLGVADDGSVFDLVNAANIQGVVVASMAAGTVPPAAYEKLLVLAKTGLPIVLCSGATSGRTAEEYYYPKAYDELRAAGVAIEDWLSPRKARIRLMLSVGLREPYVPFGREFVAERK
jgi:L-asparaginase